MAAKEVITGEQSRQTILQGVNVLADAATRNDASCSGGIVSGLRRD
jgi:hypothetical protein